MTTIAADHEYVAAKKAELKYKLPLKVVLKTTQIFPVVVLELACRQDPFAALRVQDGADCLWPGGRVLPTWPPTVGWRSHLNVPTAGTSEPRGRLQPLGCLHQ
jgi:hypothetical protein